jgi:hypothetical protein
VSLPVEFLSYLFQNHLLTFRPELTRTPSNARARVHVTSLGPWDAATPPRGSSYRDMKSQLNTINQVVERAAGTPKQASLALSGRSSPSSPAR